MWVYFNRDYKENKRGDVVDISDETFVNDVLVKDKIAQVVDDPHETYANLEVKKDLYSKITATSKK